MFRIRSQPYELLLFRIINVRKVTDVTNDQLFKIRHRLDALGVRYTRYCITLKIHMRKTVRLD